jgi:hypothetical protein
MARSGVMSLNSTNTREIRKFGLIALIFFGCLCGLGIWMNKPLPTYFFGFLSILGAGFILIPRHLTPVYTGWLKIAQFIGRVLTISILCLAYYIVITPTAIIKRFIGGRPLPVKPDKNASSYWVDRTEPAQPRERFIKRY